jgi:phenol/toluene 2-monooxygenase (NADH) P1/A1
MGYELRTNVVDPYRNTFSYLVERFGDRPATRYQEASFGVQPTENFHYRPTWDAERELYDPNYTALRLTDPYTYTDPRQYYYTPFVANAAERYESFGQTLKYIEDRRLLDRLPENWQIVCTGFVVPLRHYESGAQLVCSNAARFAYGTTVAQPVAFASMDRVGNAQLHSLVGLAMDGGGGDALEEAKKNWLYAPPLQGIRRLLEELLLEDDWAAGLIGLDLTDQLLYPVLFDHLDDRALFRGATAYSLLARHFHDWFGNHRKWIDALVKAWVKDAAHGEANAKALAGFADRWYPRANAAVRQFAEGLAESAGSTTVLGATDRNAAELAARLRKAGIPLAAGEGVPA